MGTAHRVNAICLPVAKAYYPSQNQGNAGVFKPLCGGFAENKAYVSVISSFFAIYFVVFRVLVKN
jgi:hypothetical protein